MSLQLLPRGSRDGHWEQVLAMGRQESHQQAGGLENSFFIVGRYHLFLLGLHLQ